MTRCHATIRNRRMTVYRASRSDDPRCEHRAVRVFTDGTALCPAHLRLRLREHALVLARILAIPEGGNTNGR